MDIQALVTSHSTYLALFLLFASETSSIMAYLGPKVRFLNEAQAFPLFLATIAQLVAQLSVTDSNAFPRSRDHSSEAHCAAGDVGVLISCPFTTLCIASQQLPSIPNASS